MAIFITRVRARTADDRLLVDGMVDGVVATARGWLSATRNHYPAEAYDDDGHLVEGAEPRSMSAAEIQDYARRLLGEQFPTVIDLGLPDAGAEEALAIAEGRAEPVPAEVSE